MRLCSKHGCMLILAGATDSRGKSVDFLRCPTQGCTVTRPIKNPKGKGRNQNRKTNVTRSPGQRRKQLKFFNAMIGNASYDSQRFQDKMHMPDNSDRNKAGN